MSRMRSFRVRLERLARSKRVANGQTGLHEFVVDPRIAHALRDAKHRYSELSRKRLGPSENGGPLSAAELEEDLTLSTRITELTKAIQCPPNYGLKECKSDSDRLSALWSKSISPPSCNGGRLTDAEDFEEAQLTARVAAFYETPEGRGRQRISQLSWRNDLSPDEQNELDSLKALYPHPPIDPSHPLWAAFKACGEALEREKAAALKRREEWFAARRSRDRKGH